jgi:predicted phage terminase large subunit-like protein
MELTQTQKIIKRQLLRSYYKKSYYQFFKAACQVLEPTTDWSWNFHHKFICDLLQEEAMRIKEGQPKTTDKVINVPFRSSKSLMVSICYPLWCWIVKPDMKFICLSYSESLALDHAGKSVILMESDWFRDLFPEIKMLTGFQSKTDFMTEGQGSRFSAGFLGSVLGKGADIIIMDDPNRFDMINELGLNTVTNTFRDVIYGRLNNPVVGVRFCIQQRLHMNDLTGFLLTNYPDTHTHICLPAIKSPKISPSYLQNEYQDNLLWKARFSQAVLNDYLEMLGSKGFNNQLLQEPVSEEGSIIKKAWIQTVHWQDDFNKLQWNLIVDTAYGKAKGDASAILIAARWQNGLLIKYSGRYFLEFPDLVQKIIELYRLHNCTKILIEPKGNGISVVQQIRRTTKLYVIESQSPKDDKITRANSCAPTLESKRVNIIDSSWNKDFIDEVCSFPFARYDDQLDTLLIAIEELINTGKVTAKFIENTHNSSLLPKSFRQHGTNMS